MPADEPRGLSHLGKSYLSMDVDGRVIRLDSFSKFLAPGMRLGWCTAHPDFLQKLLFALHASTMGPCSFSQVSAHGQQAGYRCDDAAVVGITLDNNADNAPCQPGGSKLATNHLVITLTLTLS